MELLHLGPSSALMGRSLLLALLDRADEAQTLMMQMRPPVVALLREVCKALDAACSSVVLWESLLRHDGVTLSGLTALDAHCLYRRLRLRDACGFELIGHGEKRTVQPDGKVAAATVTSVAIDALNPFDRPCWLLFAEAVPGGLAHLLTSCENSSRMLLAHLDETTGLRCRGFRSAEAMGEPMRGNATARALGSRGEIVLLEMALVVQPAAAQDPSQASPSTLPVYGLLLPPWQPMGKGAPTLDTLAAASASDQSAFMANQLEGADADDPPAVGPAVGVAEDAKAPELVLCWPRPMHALPSSALVVPRSFLLKAQRDVCDGATITIGKHCLERRALSTLERPSHKSCLLELDTVLCLDLVAMRADREVVLDGAAASVDLSSDAGVALRSTLDGPAERRTRRERARRAACAEPEPFPWRSRMKGAFSDTCHEISGTLHLGVPSELRMTVLRTARVPATIHGVR